MNDAMSNRFLFRFNLKTLLILQAFFAIAIWLVWWWPKVEFLVGSESYVGYYRGLGLDDNNSFFGKQFYRIRVDDSPYGHWEVEYTDPGFNRYTGYYPNGVCREEGECFVELYGGLVPDQTHLLNAKFYKPDGTLGSEVINGNGIQTLWFLNGKKRWELVLKNSNEWVSLKWWHANGQLYVSKNDGKHTSYHPNGKIKYRCEYDENGTISGTEKHFDEDGFIIDK